MLDLFLTVWIQLEEFQCLAERNGSRELRFLSPGTRADAFCFGNACL